MSTCRFILFFVAVWILLSNDSASAVFAQCASTEQARLIASDGAANDNFAISVGIDGDVAIVGAHQDDDVTLNTGSVYVYRFNGTLWTQEAKLTASDPGSGDFFAISVAISGTTIVVGAFHDDDAGSDSGSAYVFQFNGTSWPQVAKLTASDATAFDVFGSAVAIDQDVIIVGATGDDDVGSLSGSAYVFVKPLSGWTNMTQTAKLHASDGVNGQQFGYAVSISGDTAVIGAQSGGGPSNGAAYVFVKPLSGWTTMTQTAKLTASDSAANDKFGDSVSIRADTILVGAWQKNIVGSGSGAAYLFEKPVGGWINNTQTAKLTPSDGASGDNFGFSVSISEEAALVGAYHDDDVPSNSGSSYIFRKPVTGWANINQTAKLTASNATSGDQCGISVALSSDKCIIGANLGDATCTLQTGSAYIFNYLLDCNKNEQLDLCDWISESSLDCNHNGVLDECDLANRTSIDCDNNGVPDECDPDCNANLIPDACDLLSQTSEDCNADNIPDECESTVVRDSQGREFVLSFLPNAFFEDPPFQPIVELHMTSEVNTTATVEYPINNPTFSQTVMLVPGMISIVQLPASAAQAWLPGIVNNNAVRAFSDDAFTCYMFSRRRFSSDASLALPVTSLGTEYITAGYLGSVQPNVDDHGEFTIVATVDDTIVSITPANDIVGGFPAGIPFTITLDRGEGFLAQSVEGVCSKDDLTGSILRVTNGTGPVAVTNGNGCANIPPSSVACNHIFEMAQPVKFWGTQVIVANLPLRPSGSIYRILASQDNTIVNIDGIFFVKLNRAQFKDTASLSGNHIIMAGNDKPILVLQFMKSEGDESSTAQGDPAIVHLLPASQYLSNYTFTTTLLQNASPQFTQHFVTIIAENSDVAGGTIFLNSSPIAAGMFTAISGSGFSVATVELSNGMTYTTNSNGVHGITVEGYNFQDAYLYTCGALLSLPDVADCNSNGIFDACECCKGDLAGPTETGESGGPPDGVRDGIDIQAFVNVLLFGGDCLDLCRANILRIGVLRFALNKTGCYICAFVFPARNVEEQDEQPSVADSVPDDTRIRKKNAATATSARV